jgi:hypothetical protein
MAFACADLALRIAGKERVFSVLCVYSKMCAAFFAKGMKMVEGVGLRRMCGDVVYIFSLEKDAESFALCVNGGGRPAHCAELHNCIGKENKVKSNELGR